MHSEEDALQVLLDADIDKVMAGLDRIVEAAPSYKKLFSRWENQQWNSESFDFTADREQWDGDARAYLGITVPHFPNLFLMYGPNTNIVINGSITYFSECEAQFIVESIGMLLRGGFRAMEPKGEVHDAYNVLIDEGNQQMAWGVSDVNTWYRNAKGRIAQNWPFDLVRYWRQTREPSPDDYVLR